MCKQGLSSADEEQNNEHSYILDCHMKNNYF